MTAKEDKIVEAAFCVFSRYGVRRTTMNDIAAEAGIARQTLYNAFANKDEVLRATIRLHTDRSLAAIEAECAGTSDLGEQLDIVFDALVIAPYDMMNATPHANEILLGMKDVAMEEISAASRRYRDAIEQLLRPHAANLEKSGLTPAELADLVQSAMSGFRYKSEGREHLLKLLGTLKTVTLAIAGAA